MSTRKPKEELTNTMTPDDARPIIFFDGVCGLCNRFVDFVLTRDQRGLFRFAPLQGETAQHVLQPEDVESLKTVVLLDDCGVHRQSTAVIRTLSELGGLWKIAAALLWVIPQPLRNAGYRLVARCRYRLFGKREACRMPTAEERDRFLP